MGDVRCSLHYSIPKDGGPVGLDRASLLARTDWNCGKVGNRLVLPRRLSPRPSSKVVDSESAQCHLRERILRRLAAGEGPVDSGAKTRASTTLQHPLVKLQRVCRFGRFRDPLARMECAGLVFWVVLTHFCPLTPCAVFYEQHSLMCLASRTP